MIIALTLFSCKKDEENTVQVETQNTPISPNYFPLEVGNYWVYENYSVDTSGNETNLNKQDSVRVIRDTMVNGNRYFYMYGKEYPTNYEDRGWFRDSSGYLVSLGYQSKLNFVNFSDTLDDFINYTSNGDTLQYTFYMLHLPEIKTIVPAGEFAVIDYLGTTITSVEALQKLYDYPRYSHQQYAENVGKVFQSFHYSASPNHIEKRLVRYRIH
tara:strand:+ start:2116 stop:2754 length:639 start_codon:yes stop_codon:yes gene_type:complete